MTHDFSDRVVLITGACNGIGRFTAIAMLEAGARVAVADVTPCPRTMEMLEQRGSDIYFIETDVTDSKQVRNMVRKTARQFGRLDMAVNNAGVYDYGALTHEWKEDQWDRMMGRGSGYL